MRNATPLSAPVLLVLGFTSLLAIPSAANAQERSHLTVTGRLHPAVEVRVQLDPELFDEGRFIGSNEQFSVPLGDGSMVACTAFRLPDMDPDREQVPLTPLKHVEELEVRFQDEGEWRRADLEALRAAEPPACDGP